jgi:protein-tyrosine-phosphatase
MNILFICKHNLFRSRIAESYFNKINKNPDLKARSAGVIKGNFLNKHQKHVLKYQICVANEFRLKIKARPRGLSTKLLSKQDLIIITANDIPKSVFNNPSYVKKLIIWEIPDVGYLNQKHMRKTIKLIMHKVDVLVKDLRIL